MQAAAQSWSGPRAGFGTRLLAYLIDVVVLAVPAVIVFILLDIGAAYVIVLIASVAYFIVLHGGPTGQTLGKKAMSIRVIDARTGGPIGYGRAAVRWLVEGFLSGNILLLGYLWMLWDREKQTWHDKASTSVVIPVDAYPLQP